MRLTQSNLPSFPRSEPPKVAFFLQVEDPKPMQLIAEQLALRIEVISQLFGWPQVYNRTNKQPMALLTIAKLAQIVL